MKKLFMITIFMATGAALGTVLVTNAAPQTKNPSSAYEEFSPNWESAYITLSLYYVLPKDTFVVRGGEFIPGELIRLNTLGVNQIARADSDGNFVSRPFQVRAGTASSKYAVRAKGLESGAVETATFGVGTYYPTVAPSDYYLQPREKLTFSGQGFAPKEVVSIREDSTQVIRVATDASGQLSTTLTAPAEAGEHHYTFTGRESDATYSLVVT